VFSYLDDVMVVAPGPVVERVIPLVVGQLEGVGLTVNASKTAVWTPDPSTVLPCGLQGLRVDRCTVLGATAPWLDSDGDFSTLGVTGLG